MNIDQAIDRARKLFALAASDNPHEAASAAAKAQEILDRHEISQAMLDTDNNVEDDETVENFKDKDAPIDSGRSIATWKACLAKALAEANQCKVYTWSNGQRSIEIIGRPSDVQKVRYMYAYLVHEVDRLVKRDARGCGRTWANNYRLGVVDTLGKAIAATREKVAKDMRAKAANPHALVRVDNALAKLDERADAVDLFAKVHLNLRSTTRYARSDKGARQLGREAGKEIRLGGTRGALGSGTRQIGGAS